MLQTDIDIHCPQSDETFGSLIFWWIVMHRWHKQKKTLISGPVGLTPFFFTASHTTGVRRMRENPRGSCNGLWFWPWFCTTLRVPEHKRQYPLCCALQVDTCDALGGHYA
uniref:Uncharacterized protein n=1 Tax=Eutreptiella gymnastica TaxID=73025 RepID=A0A7S4LBX0_9EUGL|mmetsp:Transcript_45466/g.76558  ORF Transcript_45466/g.76558 Transcript_45466/m.76558 type:complete len:110 (-) Transcript_45466:216-545(-)